MNKILINIIQSSSLNNCTVLDDGDSVIVLDFGVTLENLIKGMGKTLERKKYLLLTHAHSDHILGMNNKSSCFFEKTFCTSTTYDFLYSKKCENIELIVGKNKWIKIDRTFWSYKAIDSFHNCNDSVCFLIKNRKHKKKILYFTDSATFKNKQLKKIDVFLIEANYGCDSLTSKSSMSKHHNDKVNHLNVDESLEIANRYRYKKTKLVVFMHISKNSSQFDRVQKICSLYSTKLTKFDYFNHLKDKNKKYWV